MKSEIQEHNSLSLDQRTSEMYHEHNIDQKNKISSELLLALTKRFEEDFAPQSTIEKNDLMQHINHFYEIQGKAERIKNTPFLMIYSAFTKLIVGFYVIIIPLFIGDIDLGGEKSGFELLAIPLMVMISTAFLTINKLANLYGEPFSQNKTSITLDEICNTITQNCLEVKAKIK